MTPEQIAKAGTEHAHQAAVFCWARPQSLKPGWEALTLLHAVPNGGDRDKAVAGRMKAEGVRAGIHDIMLPVTGALGQSYLTIEMKKPGQEKVVNGGMSEKQLEVLGAMRLHSAGMHFLCFSWLEAVAAICFYLGKSQQVAGPFVVPMLQPTGIFTYHPINWKV